MARTLRIKQQTLRRWQQLAEPQPASGTTDRLRTSHTINLFAAAFYDALAHPKRQVVGSTRTGDRDFVLEKLAQEVSKAGQLPSKPFR